jgi:hypothetical protein
MRGRSLGGRGDAPRVSLKKIVIGVLVALLAVVTAAELAGGEDEPPKVQVAALPTMGVDTRATESTDAPSKPAWAKKLEAATGNDRDALPEHRSGTSTATAPTQSMVPRRSTPFIAVERPVPRVVPHGTGAVTAKAFAKIPYSKYDRAPVGAIAHTGLHVDRITIGNGYEDSRCQGANDGFTVGRDAEVHVCLRVVHLRQKEKLVVRWEKDGQLMRRTRLPIPPYHAYRTRAGIRLRSGYEGRWRVRIMSPSGGRELAAATFTVDA